MTEINERALVEQPTVERRTPRYALRQDGDDVVLRLELPGVARDGIDVALEGKRLTVRGKWRRIGRGRS